MTWWASQATAIISILHCYAWCGQADEVATATVDEPLRTAGSFTVFPVAIVWNELMSENFSHVIERSDTSDGGRRICNPPDSENRVDIGLMARDWVPSEALRLDDGATLECYNQDTGVLTGRRVTQLEVALDGLALVVARDGAGHSCLTNPEVGGLTMAQLRWIFSASSDEELAEEGLNMESIVPNDDGDGIREWSDIHSDCSELPIHPYGVNAGSGTFHFFSARVLGTDSLNFCNESEMVKLDTLSESEATDLLKNRRHELGGSNCYVGSEEYQQAKKRLLNDGAGITYFGFGFYSRYSSELTVSRIADDQVYGIADTEQAKVAPDTYSIVDGSYAMLARSLYMNVRNTAWSSAKDFLLNGFSVEGTAAVSQAGYIPVNAAVRARMLQRVRRGANHEADYIPVPPENCPLGTGLATVEYTNAFGNLKQNYSCLACSPGQFKDSDAPMPCDDCPAGTASEVSGRSGCSLCPAGRYVNSTGASTCARCSVGSYTQSVGSFACSSCPAGRVQNALGSTACIECSLGYHQPRKAAGECLPCEPGSYASYAGQALCDLCTPGHYQAAAASNESCRRCPLGSYAAGAGSRLCEDCGATLTTQYLGAVDASQCLCKAGEFMSKGKTTLSDSPCEPCPPGMTCAIGSAYRYLPTEDAYECPKEVLCNYPLVKPGFMTRPQEPLKVYKCVEPKHCQGGPPGRCGHLRSSENVACGRCVDSPQSYPTSDECRECNGVAELLMGIVSGVVFIAAIACAVLTVNQDEIKQSVSFIILATVAGLTLTGIQAIGVFNNLSITWFEPLRSILQGMTLVSFDLGSVRVACHLGNSPIAGYAARQLVAPSVIPLSWACLMAKKYFGKRPVQVRLELINAVGALYSVFFIAVSVSAFGPWICYEHPGRIGYSVVSMPSVLCFEGDEWFLLTTMACGALLVVVLPFLSMVVFAIHQYPTSMRMEKSHYRKCFRFVFARFTTERYYYMAFLLLRNLVIVCIPMINDIAAQLLLMCGVLLGFEVLSAMLRPWRAPLVNFYDICFASLLVLILIAGIVQTEMTVSESSMTVLGSGIFAAVILLVAVGISKAIANRFLRGRAFEAFLCHHKKAAGAQARYLKIIWRNNNAQARVFIDADDLLQLDDLFEIVRLHVSRVVIFLTSEVLYRPWCCGELATAHQNNVRAAAIVASDVDPSLFDVSECIEACFEDSLLVQYRIMPDDARDAFEWVLSDAVPKLDTSGLQPGTPSMVMICSRLLERGAHGAGGETDPATVLQDCGQAAYYIISSDPLDEEASASAGILAARVPWISTVSRSSLLCLADWPSVDSDKLPMLVHNARAAVVILTVNTLQSLEQLRLILLVAACGTIALPLATPLFAFPTDAYLECALPTLLQSSGVGEQILAATATTTATATATSSIANTSGSVSRNNWSGVDLVKSFFRTIAIGFGTHASEKVIDTQCMEVAARMCSNQAPSKRSLRKGSRSTSSSYGSASMSSTTHHLSVGSTTNAGGLSSQPAISEVAWSEEI